FQRACAALSAKQNLFRTSFRQREGRDRLIRKRNYRCRWDLRLRSAHGALQRVPAGTSLTADQLGLEPVISAPQFKPASNGFLAKMAQFSSSSSRRSQLGIRFDF